MFSGIIEDQGKVQSIKLGSNALTLQIAHKFPINSIALGDSIAVDGVCLTVVDFSETNLTFELLEETVRCSSLGSLQCGDQVNLERSLTLGARISGHLVFGHVDAVIELSTRTEQVGALTLSFKYPKELARYLTEKGSVSICGVSLTLGKVSADNFSVYIIPHTASQTKLGVLKLGEKVNLELDMLARYVVGALEHAGKISKEVI